MAKTLTAFSVARSGEDYTIQIEDEDGERSEFLATYDQLDLIVEAAEEQLNGDEEDALGVDDAGDLDEADSEDEDGRVKD